MSSLTSPQRLRAPRTAEAAFERARLALVPAPRQYRGRAPFVILVLSVLATGVVGLLMFNTQMQQNSIEATKLQRTADLLVARQQKLDAELDRLRDPQHLAVVGKQLGLVEPPNPAFIRLKDGRILGQPVPATRADGVPISSRRVSVPAALRPAPVVVSKKVTAAPKPATPQGRATASATAGGGR